MKQCSKLIASKKEDGAVALLAEVGRSVSSTSLGAADSRAGDRVRVLSFGNIHLNVVDVGRLVWILMEGRK